MKQNRREFLKGTAWMLGAAAAAGHAFDKPLAGGGSGTMCNFSVPPMKRIRVGFIGVGERGTAAVKRVTLLPGIETAALCDLRPAQTDAAKKWLQEKKKTGAVKVYAGKDDSWKGVCDDGGVDVVYIATPAQLHAEMGLMS